MRKLIEKAELDPDPQGALSESVSLRPISAANMEVALQEEGERARTKVGKKVTEWRRDDKDTERQGERDWERVRVRETERGNARERKSKRESERECPTICCWR